MSFALAAKAQEIPPDVNYKRATNEINAAAKSTLESALASQAAPNDFLGGVFICGPLLWRVLKPAADQALLAGKPLVAIIQNPEVIHAQARNFLKLEEKQLFWKLLREKYPGLSSGEVRKAPSVPNVGPAAPGTPDQQMNPPAQNAPQTPEAAPAPAPQQPETK